MSAAAKRMYHELNAIALELNWPVNRIPGIRPGRAVPGAEGDGVRAGPSQHRKSTPKVNTESPDVPAR